MKRPADTDDLRNGKRRRTTPPDLLFTHERRVPDELKNDDDTGFIHGKVFMSMRRMGQFRLDLCYETNVSKKMRQIDVEMSGPWAGRVELVVGDEIRLALKGVEVVQLKKPPATGVLPCMLKYSKGISVQIVHRPGSPQDTNKLYNLWPVPKGKKASKQTTSSALKGPKADEFDWFVAPAETAETHSPKADGQNDSDASAPTKARTSSGKITESSTVARSSPALPQNGEDQVASSSKVTTHPVLTTTKVPSTSRPKSPIRGSVNNESRSLAKAIPNGTGMPSHPTKRLDTAEARAPHVKVRGSPIEASGSAVLARPGNPTGPAATLATSTTNMGKESSVLPVSTSIPKPVISKRQRKKQMLAQKQTGAIPSTTASAANDAPAHRASGVLQPVEIDIGALVDGPDVNDGIKSTDLSHRAQVSDATSTAKPEQANGSDTPLKMRAGLQTTNGPYVPLASVRAGKMVSVIGVCTSAKQVARSRTGDWGQTLFLLDPSNIDASGGYLYRPDAGLMISCFTKKYAQWVPSPKEGQVVILRMLKAVEFNNNLMAKGYHDKMRWAMYDPDTGHATHGDLSAVPRAEGLDDGDGLMFSPFWDPTDVELSYCATLTKWWDAVQKERKAAMGTEIQVGGDNANPHASRGRAPRQHRLIADTTPGTEPDGYFDCTVEILQGFMNSGNPYTIYVTDYTGNSGLHPATANWCPGNLADKCLKIELWDEAAGIGPDMKPGEFWSFSNVRMIVSGNGYSEAKFKEARKAEKLDEIDATTHHHLKLLLERKKEWEKTNTSPNEFPHRLLSEVKELEIFDCTVEVLHSVYDPKGFSEIFVTDYTERDDLATPPSEDWSNNLDRCVVKIELRDGQNDFAKKMESGSFFKIQNLRLRERKMAGTGKLVGYLGGNDRLVMKLNPKNEENKELAALLARKAELRSTDAKSKPSGHRLVSTVASTARKGYSSVSQILSTAECPGRFRLRARVVDFWPLSLEDCVLALCRKCHNVIPANRTACVECNDMLMQHVCQVYQLFLRLEDESGDIIQVAIDENWADLAGLSPDDVTKDPEVLRELRERLHKYIGNLEEVHDALEHEVAPPETHTPFHEFTVVSWPIPDTDGKIAYGLR